MEFKICMFRLVASELNHSSGDGNYLRVLILNFFCHKNNAI